MPLPGDYYHGVSCAFSPDAAWLFVGCGGRGYLLDPDPWVDVLIAPATV